MRRTVAIIAGLLLLLGFAQCKKEKTNQESDESFELACDAGEYIDDNIQSQLDLLNDKTTPEAMAALAEWIKGQEGVASAVAFNDRVEYVYVDGTKGSVMVYDQTIENDFNYNFNKHSLTPHSFKLQHGNAVGSQKGFIYDAFPYLSSRYNVGDSIQKRFEEGGFEYAHPKEEDCTIDTLNAMFQYGYIQFITHADSDVFSTGERVTRKKRALYRDGLDNDLFREARLVIKTGLLGFKHRGRFFGVTSKYIKSFQYQFDNAIVFMGACKGFPEENALMKDAFLARHAATYFGFSNDVISRIVYATSNWIVSNLFYGRSVGEAYDIIYYSEDGNCTEFDYEGNTIKTCFLMESVHDIMWYETPPVAPLPQVITKEVENITATSALFRGTVISEEGCQEIVERGFCYGTGPGQFYGNVGGDAIVYEGPNTEDFACEATSLYSDMQYYVRAYAKMTSGEVCYGDELSFNTLTEEEDPQVFTFQPESITMVSAALRGGVTGGTSQTVTERGFCYGMEPNQGIGNFGSNRIPVGSGSGSFAYNLDGLTPNTIYYVKAYAITDLDHIIYGEELSFSTLSGGGGGVPVGVINGMFTINANGNQVYFSRGNLQFQASANMWRFAENQWDYLGEDNANISSTYSGWIDLFGWGTSGWNCGNTYFRPWDISNGYNDNKLYGPFGENNLTGDYAQSDWGYYNAISNGGDQNHLWRTLTQEEWDYVFQGRNTSSGIRYAKAQVNGIKGIILLPDDWNVAIYTLNNTNQNDASYDSNVIGMSQWNILEDEGAVFLPAAGWRSGHYLNMTRGYGDYWSASYYSIHNAYAVFFSDFDLITSYDDNRSSGCSIRLVFPAVK